MAGLQSHIGRVLIPQERIAERVRELAGEITRDHAHAASPGGGEITIVQVLTGAFIFCGDLIRHIPLPIRIGLLTVSSYPGTSLRTQGSTVLSQQLGELRGRHVVLIDDILDSGDTVAKVVPVLQELGAAEVKTCVLLRKDRPGVRTIQADYVGFDIPDEFVVGYGLDYNDYYRNLPDIVTLTPQAIAWAGGNGEVSAPEKTGT